jgi:hypothetical protein
MRWRHEQALQGPDQSSHRGLRVLTKDRLSEDERWFVLENWKESATHINSAAGAFFTPPMLARDFAIETCGPRVIDLCAGIGCLAFMVWNKSGWAREPIEIVCVERNPDYAAVGRKVLPEARWIVGDVFDLPPDLGCSTARSLTRRSASTDRGGRSAPRYQGRAFEYHVIDVASDLADWGAFIIPQNSAPFRLQRQACLRVAARAPSTRSSSARRPASSWAPAAASIATSTAATGTAWPRPSRSSPPISPRRAKPASPLKATFSVQPHEHPHPLQTRRH